MLNNPSRLGIFVFYDPQGIVDDYVIHLMASLRPHFTRIVTVSNTKVDHTAKERLEKYSDDLIVRENRGLDAAAFKECLVSYCGWKEVSRYDEVVLFNDTFFGPILSFEDMFLEMNQKDIDFWGMSAGYHSHDGWNKVKYGYMPDHIQTFFVAFRKKMVCSEEFQSYWNSYDETLNDFVSIVSQHEVVMTKHFQDLGFRWAIYANTDHYRSKHRSENFNLFYCHPHTMIRDMKFPVFKKKTLNINIADQLNKQDLESSADAMHYIHAETEYDTKMIWDNVLRLYNVADLYHSLHLNYVLPSIPVELPVHRQAALVYRISNLFFAEQLCKHASQISSLIDVYIIPEEKSIRQRLEEILKTNDRISLLEASNQQTEMGCFLLCCKELAKKYDYLGYIHDAANPEHYPTSVIESSVYGSLQNIANDPAYVSQVLNCFEANPRLGLLGAPFPIHHHNFTNYGDGWAGYFADTTKLAKKMGLNCNLDEEKAPFFITGNFWCRTDAIRSIWEYGWDKNQFHVNANTHSSRLNETLKRVLPFAAQSQRYYSGIIMHTNYASMRLSSQQYMLTQIVRTTQTQLNCKAPSYQGYMEQLSSICRSNNGSPFMMDLSRFSRVKRIQIYLDQNMPPWVTQRINRSYNFLRAVLAKRKR